MTKPTMDSSISLLRASASSRAIPCRRGDAEEARATDRMTRRSGGPPSQRQLRVGEELRHALVRILGRGGLRDPELEGVQVTVTEVSVSPDLRNATAFIVPFGGSSSDKLVKAL